MNESSFLVHALTPVLAAFEALGVRYYVGGSVASSFHGAVRSTMDVDLVCDLNDQQVARFIQQIGADLQQRTR